MYYEIIFDENKGFGFIKHWTTYWIKDKDGSILQSTEDKN